METLTIDDPWSKMLRKGIILWRPCSFSVKEEKCDVGDVVFEPTDRNSYIVRLALTNNGIWEPQIMSQRNGDFYEPGIVVFVDEIPPANWTHLVVSGVSKPFEKPGKPERGGCLFAKIGKPYELQDYVDFRLAMFRSLHKEQSAPISRAIEISNENWIGGKWAGKIANGQESRLILQKAWTDSAHYNYGCIVPPKD